LDVFEASVQKATSQISAAEARDKARKAEHQRRKRAAQKAGKAKKEPKQEDKVSSSSSDFTIVNSADVITEAFCKGTVCTTPNCCALIVFNQNQRFIDNPFDVNNEDVFWCNAVCIDLTPNLGDREMTMCFRLPAHADNKTPLNPKSVTMYTLGQKLGSTPVYTNCVGGEAVRFKLVVEEDKVYGSSTLLCLEISMADAGLHGAGTFFTTRPKGVVTTLEAGKKVSVSYMYPACKDKVWEVAAFSSGGRITRQYSESPKEFLADYKTHGGGSSGGLIITQVGTTSEISSVCGYHEAMHGGQAEGSHIFRVSKQGYKLSMLKGFRRGRL
jgi:hypothetical protein